MQALTNISMMYLNYPAKVLFKSSRMVPIMCFGVIWQVKNRLETEHSAVGGLSLQPILTLLGLTNSSWSSSGIAAQQSMPAPSCPLR